MKLAVSQQEDCYPVGAAQFARGFGNGVEHRLQGYPGIG